MAYSIPSFFSLICSTAVMTSQHKKGKISAECACFFSTFFFNFRCSNPNIIDKAALMPMIISGFCIWTYAPVGKLYTKPFFYYKSQQGGGGSSEFCYARVSGSICRVGAYWYQDRSHANHQFMHWPRLGEAPDARMVFLMTYSVDWSVLLGSNPFTYIFYKPGSVEAARMYLSNNGTPQAKYFMFFC